MPHHRPHMNGSIVLARWRKYAPRRVQFSQHAIVPVLPLLSRFEYIDRRTCVGMSWADSFSPSKLPIHA